MLLRVLGWSLPSGRPPSQHTLATERADSNHRTRRHRRHRLNTRPGSSARNGELHSPGSRSGCRPRSRSGCQHGGELHGHPQYRTRAGGRFSRGPVGAVPVVGTGMTVAPDNLTVETPRHNRSEVPTELAPTLKHASDGPQGNGPDRRHCRYGGISCTQTPCHLPPRAFTVDCSEPIHIRAANHAYEDRAVRTALNRPDGPEETNVSDFTIVARLSFITRLPTKMCPKCKRVLTMSGR
ncbi:hypothetical protein ABH922_001239 [Rhodococcus sp. 27YEA15]